LRVRGKKLPAQNLSVGAFVYRLAPLEELLQKKDCFRHLFAVTWVCGTFPNVIFTPSLFSIIVKKEFAGIYILENRRKT
jgi:hypothetical protein